MGKHMTDDEALLARQALDRDKRFTGAVFSRIKWGSDDYRVHLQLKNRQEFKFSALKDFGDWHARYRVNRQTGQRTRRHLAHPQLAESKC